MIKLTNAALDERDGEIILRGVVDPESLDKLQTADYQREVLPSSTISQLADAIRKRAGVPDIQLGMRGGQFQEKNNAFYLTDPVYIIDGLQRTSAALRLLKGGTQPYIGAVVYFNTNEDSERTMFKNLNMMRIKLSPNVLLKNEAKDSVFLDMLLSLCKDSSFALKGRVSWQQSMTRAQLVTAANLVRITSALHHRFGGSDWRQHTINAAQQLDAVVVRLKRSTLRDNIKLFINTVDDMWNIREVVYRERAPYLRAGFLTVLARIMNDHEDFWEDTRLVIPSSLRKKLSTFPMNDPQVAQLCGSIGQARKILYIMIVDHINSGKRTRRLTPLHQQAEPPCDEEAAVEEAMESAAL
jgi:hypothetical protein